MEKQPIEITNENKESLKELVNICTNLYDGNTSISKETLLYYKDILNLNRIDSFKLVFIDQDTLYDIFDEKYNMVGYLAAIYWLEDKSCINEITDKFIEKYFNSIMSYINRRNNLHHLADRIIIKTLSLAIDKKYVFYDKDEIMKIGEDSLSKNIKSFIEESIDKFSIREAKAPNPKLERGFLIPEEYMDILNTCMYLPSGKFKLDKTFIEIEHGEPLIKVYSVADNQIDSYTILTEEHIIKSIKDYNNINGTTISLLENTINNADDLLYNRLYNYAFPKGTSIGKINLNNLKKLK